MIRAYKDIAGEFLAVAYIVHLEKAVGVAHKAVATGALVVIELILELEAQDNGPDVETQGDRKEEIDVFARGFELEIHEVVFGIS